MVLDRIQLPDGGSPKITVMLLGCFKLLAGVREFGDRNCLFITMVKCCKIFDILCCLFVYISLSNRVCCGNF